MPPAARGAPPGNLRRCILMRIPAAGRCRPAAGIFSDPIHETLCPRVACCEIQSKIRRHYRPIRLRTLGPGMAIELWRAHLVTVSEAKHTVPSLGFVVWERRRKLKDEYQTLTGPQIRNLRLGGTDVTEERRTPRFAYLGDSAPEGL